jgi:Protein of unknown function (DUF3261)
VAEIPAIPAAGCTTTSRHRLSAMVAAGLGLAGCTLVGPAPPDLPDGRVTVAPGLVFSLPPPSALERNAEALQLVTAHYRHDVFVFETRISVTPTRLLAVGTDMLGRRAMTIEWTGSDLHVEAEPWVPPELRARNVVADIMLLHWPVSAVRAGLSPAGVVRETSPGHRVIAVDGRDMIRIDRIAGTPGSWSGRWTYRNLAWGYDLDIQSTEATP